MSESNTSTKVAIIIGESTLSSIAVTQLKNELTVAEEEETEGAIGEKGIVVTAVEEDEDEDDEYEDEDDDEEEDEKKKEEVENAANETVNEKETYREVENAADETVVEKETHREVENTTATATTAVAHLPEEEEVVSIWDLLEFFLLVCTYSMLFRCAFKHICTFFTSINLTQLTMTLIYVIILYQVFMNPAPEFGKMVNVLCNRGSKIIRFQWDTTVCVASSCRRKE